MAIAEALGQFMQLEVILLFIGFFIFIVIAYKIFRVVTKALIIGLMGAAFPVVVNFLGFNNMFGIEIALSFQNIIFFALVGIVAFLVYYIISGIVKVVGFVARPFTGGRKGEIRKELKKELKKREEQKKRKQAKGKRKTG
jgi:hypothetical protein